MYYETKLEQKELDLAEALKKDVSRHPIGLSIHFGATVYVNRESCCTSSQTVSTISITGMRSGPRRAAELLIPFR